jgi:phage shock protein C
MREKRLYRSRSDKVLMGLCGGLGDYFNVDPTLIRVAFIILEFLTAGLLIVAYFIVGFIVPKEPEQVSPKT